MLPVGLEFTKEILAESVIEVVIVVEEMKLCIDPWA